jgi:hypothetical protein
LPNSPTVSNGVFKNVYHFDSKADIEEYTRTLGIPSTFFYAGMYMTNFTPLSSFRLAPQEPHTLTLGLPTSIDQRVMPLFHAQVDTGKFVKGILKHRDSLLGKRIYGATDYYSMADIAAAVREVKGVDAVAVEITPAQYRAGMAAAGMPEFVQVEVSENFEMLSVCGYFNKESFGESHAVRIPPSLSPTAPMGPIHACPYALLTNWISC